MEGQEGEEDKGKGKRVKEMCNRGEGQKWANGGGMRKQGKGEENMKPNGRLAGRRKLLKEEETNDTRKRERGEVRG